MRPTTLLMLATSIALVSCTADEAGAPAQPTEVSASVTTTIDTSTTTVPSPDATAPSPSTSQPTPISTPETTSMPVDVAGLQELLDQWRSDVDAYGATLSIRIPGQPDIALASGVDDRDVAATRLDGSPTNHTETPMTTGGTFPVLHITKTFIAAAALQLVDEGRLSLDEPVAAWLPELPNSDTITLRMLLSYTSGLAPWWEDDVYIPELLAEPTKSWQPSDVLAEYLRKPPIADPGGDPVLGGVGYIATGLLIERVLGEDLRTVLEHRFIEPLALDDTTLSDGTIVPTRHGWLSGPGAADPNRTFDMHDQPSQAVMTTLWADRGMISSSADMLTWGAALFGGHVLGNETTAAMLQMNPAKVPPVPNRYFALGATGYCLHDGCTPDDVELVGGPGGNSFGWSSQLVHQPETGITIIVQANVSVPQAAQLIQLPIDVIDLLDNH